MEKIKTIKTYSKALTASALIVGASAAGAALQHDQNSTEFPGMFIDDDGETDTSIVVGDEARTIDVVGGIDIAEALGSAEIDGLDEDHEEDLQDDDSEDDHDEDDTDDNGEVDDEENGLEDETHYVGALDTDEVIDDRKEDQNMVLVGGPAVNELTNELAEDNRTIAQEDYQEGEGYIDVVEDAFADGQHVLIVSGHEGVDTREAARYVVDNPEEIEGEETITVTTN